VDKGSEVVGRVYVVAVYWAEWVGASRRRGITLLAANKVCRTLGSWNEV